ncbi:MAG: hypothetical protein AMJ79_10000 [Phycisphaerae bacterium SM23_30]|nr:MAG: hypothetical protein AMJ79_10000 [Phycisphaerae bacterium SM23_30]
MDKPKVGIYGLTGCAGDQLVILNCEDELLDLVGSLDIKSFSMAASGADDQCQLDIAFVEGTVVQPDEEKLLKDIRQRAKLLVAIGTCAVWGGVTAMKNEVDPKKFIEQVYGPAGKVFEVIPPQPLSSFVKVDLSLPGCPIEKEQLLRGVASLLHGDLPKLPNYAVCTECKMAEYPCILVEKGLPCLGPITVAGCGARCPSYGLTCNGCRGPVDDINVASEINILKEKGFTWVDIQNRLRTFAAPAPPLNLQTLEEAKNA